MGKYIGGYIQGDIEDRYCVTLLPNLYIYLSFPIFPMTRALSDKGACRFRDRKGNCGSLSEFRRNTLKGDLSSD